MTRKEELYPEIIKQVTGSDIWSISDLICFLPISKSTFYDYYPSNSDELEAIKKRIDQNRIRIKLELRKRLLESDNPTAIIAAYKLVCSKEEFNRLSSRTIIEDNDGNEDDNLIKVIIETSQSQSGGNNERYQQN